MSVRSAWGSAEFQANGEQGTDRGTGLAIADQLDRIPDTADCGHGYVVRRACGCLKSFHDRRDLRWQGISHKGGHQCFYLEQEALLGSVGCAHVP